MQIFGEGGTGVSVEIRHMERDFLYKLLKIKNMDEIKNLITNLMATMEPKDVELVRKKYMELEAKRQNK